MSQLSDKTDRRKGKGCELSQDQECKKQQEASEEIEAPIPN